MRISICVVATAMMLSCCTLEARGRAHPKTKQHAQSTWAIGVPRYVAGGIVGSTLGVGLPLTAVIMRDKQVWSYNDKLFRKVNMLSIFGSGLGHAIQGRWYRGHGWGFTFGGFYTYVALLSATEEEDNQAFTWTLFIGTKLGELISVWWPPHRSASPLRQIDIDEYVAGGFLGTVVGFGSGHLLQGRGIASAWPYALTQVAALAWASVDSKCEIHCGMIDDSVPGIMLFVISKLIETISVWGISAIDYKIVSPRADPHAPKLALIPLLHERQPKLALQLTVAL